MSIGGVDIRGDDVRDARIEHKGLRGSQESLAQAVLSSVPLCSIEFLAFDM